VSEKTEKPLSEDKEVDYAYLIEMPPVLDLAFDVLLDLHLCR
jgi:hypothetical protein